MPPVTPRPRDPAPSRLSYRLQRLWLTPLVRALLKTGLPALVILVGVFWVLSDGNRIELVRQKVASTRYNIEHLPEFTVKLMRIDNASREVSDDIREVTAIDFPVSSFDLNLNEIRARIEELDAVASADLAIRSGGVLVVKVLERKPAIVWRSRDALELLDETGHRVAALARRTDRPDLMLIAGDGADQVVPEALRLFKVAGPIAPRVRGLLRVGQRRWDVILDRNQRIMLPETGAVAALERVLALNEMSDLLNRDIAVVDFRNGRRPTLRLNARALGLLRPVALKSDGVNPL